MFEVITSYFPMLTKQVMLSAFFLMAVIITSLALNWNTNRRLKAKPDVGDKGDPWAQEQLDEPPPKREALWATRAPKNQSKYAVVLFALREEMMRIANEGAQRKLPTAEIVQSMIRKCESVLMNYYEKYHRTGPGQFTSVGIFVLYVFSAFAEVVRDRVGKGNEVSYAKYYLEFIERHTRLTGLMALAYRHKGQVGYTDRIEYLMAAVSKYFDCNIMKLDNIDEMLSEESTMEMATTDYEFKQSFYKTVVDADFMPSMKHLAEREQQNASRMRTLNTRHNREQRAKRLRREAQHRKTA